MRSGTPPIPRPDPAPARWKLARGTERRDHFAGILGHAGGVEVGELANHDEKFDEWLETQRHD
jgi:hypothetical protein